MSDLETKADPLEPLVRRYLLSGDEEAMDRLVRRTRPKLLAVARRIGAPQDAEDAVQGAYMALVRKRGSDLAAPVLPWLLTTVVRLAYRRKAKQARQRDLAERLARPREPRSPERAVLAAEREDCVRHAVARLPAGYRDALVLRHLEGLSTKETATLLEVSEVAVRSRVHRGLRLLRGPMAPVLMALLLALPWVAADAWRRLVPLTRPAWGPPWGVAAVTGGLLLGSWALLGGLGGESTDVRARATGGPTHLVIAPPPEGRTAPPPPEPDDEIAPEDLPPEGKAEARPAPVVGAVPDAPEPEPTPPARTEASPLDPSPESVAPGAVPIDFGDGFAAPEPPGMVALVGGHVPIGTPTEVLEKLLAGRPAEHRRLFAHESPRHTVFLRPYFIGRYEVSNAQYLRYLRDQAVRHVTRRAGAETLETVAAAVLGLTLEEVGKPRHLAWRQLYRANKGRIWRALGARMDDLFVWNAQHEVDEERTAERLRREPLPTGLALDFYRVPPPWHWPDLKPPPGEEDHPVRCVSYDQAERFAEWAGLHLPTEAEWEWAARGSDGHRFPWGEEWLPDARRAVWGGLVTDDAHEPTTRVVDSHGAPEASVAGLEDGRSWCGVHHLCGNVAEWTSSWFQAYPGARAAHTWMGAWVKVIRGGGAADGEMLVLRSACRNYVGSGPDAPPYPENSFQWVGVRLAAWRQPGRDQVQPVLRRALRERHLDAADVDPERFAAFVRRDWARPDEAVEHHVYVQGRAHAVLFVPVVALLREQGKAAMQQAWRRSADFRSTSGLLRRSEGTTPWTLGVLHTDLALHGVAVAAPEGAAAPRRGTGGRSLPPATRIGPVAPGTYLLSLWHRRLALHTPALEFVGFLPEAEAKLPSIGVGPRLSKDLGPPTLTPALEAGEGDLDLVLALGGRHHGSGHVVRVRARLPFEPGALFALAPWLRSHR